MTTTSGRVIFWTRCAFTCPKRRPAGRTPCSATSVRPSPSVRASTAPSAADSGLLDLRPCCRQPDPFLLKFFPRWRETRERLGGPSLGSGIRALPAEKAKVPSRTAGLRVEELDGQHSLPRDWQLLCGGRGPSSRGSSPRPRPRGPPQPRPSAALGGRTGRGGGGRGASRRAARGRPPAQRHWRKRRPPGHSLEKVTPGRSWQLSTGARVRGGKHRSVVSGRPRRTELALCHVPAAARCPARGRGPLCAAAPPH